MNKYICLNCKKEYKIEIYYKKHCEKKICIILYPIAVLPLVAQPICLCQE